jgi:quinol monooxygenase YgiN
MKERCGMIHVIATINLTEGKRALYLEELNKIIPLVRSEDGCLEYGPAADVPAGIPIQEPINVNTITIVERWSDVDALKTHLTAFHMQSYREAVKDYVKLVRIRVLAPL